MFTINDDMSIYLTRGDAVYFTVTAYYDGENYIFHAGDILRMKVFERKACDNVVLQKDFSIEVETERVEILLTREETKIGEVISKPTDYWYEIELNPHTNPQTIIGYDEDGAKVFRLYPEGTDADDIEGGGSLNFDIVGGFDGEGQFFGWQVYSAIAVNQGLDALEERLAKAILEEAEERKEATETLRLENEDVRKEMETLREEIIGELDEISALVGEVT